MSLKIIVDSGSDLSLKEAEKLGVILVSLSVKFGENHYIDGVDISKDEFFEKLENSKDYPVTGALSPEAYNQAFKKIKDDGDKAICITLSNDISGSYQSAKIASQGFEDCIYILDSNNCALSERLLVEYAVEKIKDGYTFEKLINHLEEVKSKAKIYAYVDTLEYVKKGGRLSKTAGIIGGLLNIKLILSINEEGKIYIPSKTRGIKSGLQELDKKLKEDGAYNSDKIYLSYSGRSKENLFRFIDTYIKKYEEIELDISQLGLTIGAHSGPGTVVVAFMKN